MNFVRSFWGMWMRLLNEIIFCTKFKEFSMQLFLRKLNLIQMGIQNFRCPKLRSWLANVLKNFHHCIHFYNENVNSSFESEDFRDSFSQRIVCNVVAIDCAIVLLCFCTKCSQFCCCCCCCWFLLMFIAQNLTEPTIFHLSIFQYR